MSQGKRFTRGERALIGLGILVPTVALAWIGMDRKLNTVPDFVPPAQTIPAPNAQDTLRNAYALRVNTWEKKNIRFEDMLKAPLSERQKYLEANQKTIVMVHEALKQGYATPIDWRNPMAQTFPQYTEHRELARFLALAARTYSDMGNRKEAISCALDAVEMGIKVSGDGPLIGYLVGMACETIGRKALWEQLDSLTPAEAQEVLARLESLEPDRAPLKNFLRIERAYSQKIISDLAHRVVKPVDFASMMTGESEDKANQSRMMLTLALADKGAAWKASGEYFDAMEAYWSRPYSRTGAPKPPADALNQILLPVFEQANFNYTRNQADSALLRGYLMLRAQGAAPAQFEAPADPFGQDKPLRYETTAKGYRLWSVGPDGKDDGGKPMDTKHSNARAFNSTEDGDIVGRVNTF